MTSKQTETQLSQDEFAHLQMFTPGVYAICLPRDIGKSLEKKGLVDWVPPVWGNDPNWQITDAGKSFLERPQ